MAKKKAEATPEAAPKAKKERWDENFPPALARGLEAAGCGHIDLLRQPLSIPEEKVWRCTLNDGRRLTITFDGELIGADKSQSEKNN